MPSDIQRLRQQNVFGEYDPNQEMMDLYQPPPMEMYDPYQDMGMPEYEPQPVQMPQAPQAPAAPQISFQDNWNKIMNAYTPETSARDRQNRLLDNYPGQYTPTTGDRWTAALMGLGERNKPNGDVLAVQNQILQGPRMRDIEDWKNQITPAGVASTNENARNIQERTLLSNAITADTQAQQLAERGRIADEKAEIARQRNIIADYVARGAKVISMPNSPTIWMTGPDGKPFNTGVPTGSLSEAESIRARGNETVRAVQAGATANPVRNMVVGPDGQPLTPQGPGGAYAPTPGLGPGGVTRPGSPGSNNGPNQNELDARNDTKISSYISMNPGSASFFTQDPVTRSYTMADPPQPPNTGIIGHWTGSAQTRWDNYYKEMEQYNKAKKTFFPNQPPSPIVGYDTPAPDGTPARRPNAGTVPGEVHGDPPRGQVTSDMPAIPPAGTIRMKAPDGRIVNVPANKVAEAESRGGRRLQ